MLNRIKEYIDCKQITIAQFERSIGMSNASFGKSLKNGGAIGSDKIEKILIIYPDINPTWLLTGRGDMLVRVEKGVETVVKETSPSYATKAPEPSPPCKHCEALERVIKAQEDQIKAKESEIRAMRELIDAERRLVEAYKSTLSESKQARASVLSKK
jgi:hypothetical protein